MCEAPGGFILALEYFLQKTQNVSLDWKAQSLNPKNKLNIKKYGKKPFGDDFSLMKDFPDRWIFGDKKDDTGDISKSANIKFYNKYCKDIKLLTSDCGLSRDENWEVRKEMNIIERDLDVWKRTRDRYLTADVEILQKFIKNYKG